MSRRKQPKPRHLEAENELAALLENGTQPESPVSPAAIGDAHVCGKCRAEFFDLSEFLTHKKNCSHKRIVVLYDDAEKGTGNNMDDDVDASSLVNGENLVGDDLMEDDIMDKVAEDSVVGDSLDALAALEKSEFAKSDFADNKSDLGSNDGEDSVSPDIDGDLNDDDEDDLGDDGLEDTEESMDIDMKLHAKEMMSKMASSKDILAPLLKPELLPMFPFGFPGMPGLPGLPGGMPPSALLPDSNVKLASLEGTKVAMAQFAENNLANLPPNADVATLQSMLFSLHQQQILQLQLLQQLQQQLMAGMAPSMAASIQAQIAGQYLLPQTTPTAGTPAPPQMASSEHQPTSATTATAGVTPASHHTTNSTAKSTTTTTTSGMSMTKAPPTPLPRSSSEPSSTSSSVPATPTFELPPSASKSVMNAMTEATSRMLFGMNAKEMGPMPNFPKEGERPFKCNICGNRFSTRGNLKVHFARHKDKYPHVKMNPHPVPEHLERLSNNPILVAPVPAMVDRDMLPPSLMPEKKPRLDQPLMDRQRPGSAENSNSSSVGTRLSVTSPASSTGGQGASSAVHGPTPAASEAPARSSPNVSDTAAMSTSGLNIMAESKSESKTTTSRPSSQTSPGQNMNNSSLNKPPSIPMGSPNIPGSSTPLLMSPHHPIMSLAPTPGQMLPGMPPGIHPFGFPESPFFAPPSILPSNEDDSMEQFMECNKSETTKLEQLVQNLETKLTDPNQCAICHRILSCKSALQMHYRTHTGERPFKCKICGRAFTTKGNLKTHMGVHRAKPPMRMLHQCPVCHKQFTNALVLQQHIRMHTGEITKDMPSLMPVPASMAEMMPGPYMPFPGFPFMAPMYPHPGSHPLQNNQNNSSNSSGDQVGNSGELDLRKPPSLKKSEDGTNSEAGSEKKDSSLDQEKMDIHGSEDNMSSAGSSNNEAFGMDGVDMMEKAEKQNQEPEMDDVDMESESQPARSPAAESDHHDAPSRSSLLSENEMKSEQGGHASPFSSTSTTPTPTPPASKSTADFKPPNEYLSLFSQVSTMSNYLPPSTSSYSTSLMALEERVKAIEAPNPLYNYNSQRPLEQMASIVRRQEGQVTPPGGAGSSHSHSPGAASQPGDFDSGNTSPASTANRDGTAVGGSLSPSSQSSQGNPNSSSPFYPSKMDRDSALFGLPPGMGMSPYKGFGALDLTPRLHGSGRPNTTCNICYKTFACKSALDIHYRGHTRDRPFKCEVCERCFSTKGNMKQHMLTHKIRDLPSEAFNQQEQKIDGQPVPDSPQSKSELTPPTTPVKDDIDSKPTLSSMSTPPDAVKPQPVMATTTPPSAGSITTPPTPAAGAGAASTSSTSSSATSNNSSNGNSLESPFVRRPSAKHVCQMCHKPFSSASALQIHIRTHTGDKPFKCTICGKAFTTKGNLKVHMGTHMWNNSPSRRGRRMSMDTLPGFPGVHTGVPPRPDEPSRFFNNFPHRPPQPPHHPPPHAPEMYPFFPGFPNGFSPKMNEISVIQSINGNMGHIPGHPPPTPTSEGLMGRPAPPPLNDSMAKHPTLPAPESPLKTPPNLSLPSSDTILKSPILKAEMKSPDNFFMKAPEPHVIAPHEPSKMDIPHRPAEPPGLSPSPDKLPKGESNNNNPLPMNNGTSNSGGELDLSLPHKPSIPSPISAVPSPPVSITNNNTSPSPSMLPVPVAPLPPPPPMSPMSSPSLQQNAENAASWMWRSSKMCASPAGLERHMKGHMPQHPEESSPKPLMT